MEKNGIIFVPLWYTKKEEIMLVISSREFREKQAEYFDRADKGEQIIVQRGKSKSYKIVAVSEDDAVMSKEDFFKKIETALLSIKKGEFATVKNKGELSNLLDSL